LWIRYQILGHPEHVDERLAAGTEIVRLAEETGAAERAFAGHYLRIEALMELGDKEAGYAEIDAYDRLANELRQPQFLGWATLYRATRELIGGRFEEFDRLHQENLAWVERAQAPLLTQQHRWQVLSARRLQLGGQAIEADVQEEAERSPGYWLVPPPGLVARCDGPGSGSPARV
jgi:hypothetical protein